MGKVEGGHVVKNGGIENELTCNLQPATCNQQLQLISIE